MLPLKKKNIITDIKKKSEEFITINSEDKIKFLLSNVMDNKKKEININYKLDDNIIVTYNNFYYKFSFYDSNDNDNILGSFDIYQLIKYIYINSCNLINENFLKSIDLDKSKYIIEKYICKISNDKSKLKIMMCEYTESPFMRNIELLIQLNNSISYFEENLLNNEINILDVSDSLKCRLIIIKFICLLIQSTMYIIKMVCSYLNNNNNIQGDASFFVGAPLGRIQGDANSLVGAPKGRVQDKYFTNLIVYSNELVLKLHNYIKFQFDCHLKKYTKIQSIICTNNNLLSLINNKFNDITNNNTSNKLGIVVNNENTSNKLDIVVDNENKKNQFNTVIPLENKGTFTEISSENKSSSVENNESNVENIMGTDFINNIKNEIQKHLEQKK